MHAFGFLFFVAGGGCVFVRGEPPFVLGSVRFGWLPSFWVGVVLFLIVTRSFPVIPTLLSPPARRHRSTIYSSLACLVRPFWT